MSVEDGLVEGSKDGPDAWGARWEAAEEVAEAGVDAGAQQLIKLIRARSVLNRRLFMNRHLNSEVAKLFRVDYQGLGTILFYSDSE